MTGAFLGTAVADRVSDEPWGLELSGPDAANGDRSRRWLQSRETLPVQHEAPWEAAKRQNGKTKNPGYS